MSTTTLTVGAGTPGSFTDLTASGTYEIVVDGASGVLNMSGSGQTGLTATIATMAENGVLFTDEISSGAFQDFNPSTLTLTAPFFDVGFAPNSSIEPGFGTLELGNNLASSNVVPPLFFGGTHNDLIFAPSLTSAFLAEISGYATTDTIDLQGITNAAAVVWNQNPGTTGGVLTLISAADTGLAQVTLASGTFATSLFSIATDSVGGAEIMVACYRAGTRIATPSGEIAVEDLAIGDRVVTADGSAKPVKWLGRRAYSGRFAAGKTHLLPIRFAPGSLGNGRPRRDLWVSPQHAMLIDGALIPAACLVNGASIVQETTVDRIDYVHVELERHDVIFAEGAASETYINDDNRMMFHNARDYAARYGYDAVVHDYCAGRIEDGTSLAAIRTRLAALAGIVAPAPDHGTLQGWFERIETDADGRWAVGWARDQQAADTPVCFEILLRGRLIYRGIANRHRPDLEDAGIGSGRHGFRIALPATAAMAEILIRRVADRAVLPGYSEVGALCPPNPPLSAEPLEPASLRKRKGGRPPSF